MDFDYERFLKITFDILGKIAEEFVPIKEKINSTHKGTKYEKMGKFQIEIRKLMGKYEPELMEKYDLSFSQYNQDARLYMRDLEKYLLDKPEISAQYKKLLDKITPSENKPKIEIDEKIDEETHFKPPSRFPMGIDKFD